MNARRPAVESWRSRVLSWTTAILAGSAVGYGLALCYLWSERR